MDLNQSWTPQWASAWLPFLSTVGFTSPAVLYPCASSPTSSSVVSCCSLHSSSDPLSLVSGRGLDTLLALSWPEVSYLLPSLYQHTSPALWHTLMHALSKIALQQAGPLNLVQYPSSHALLQLFRKLYQLERKSHVGFLAPCWFLGRWSLKNGRWSLKSHVGFLADGHLKMLWGHTTAIISAPNLQNHGNLFYLADSSSCSRPGNNPVFVLACLTCKVVPELCNKSAAIGFSSKTFYSLVEQPSGVIARCGAQTWTQTQAWSLPPDQQVVLVLSPWKSQGKTVSYNRALFSWLNQVQTQAQAWGSEPQNFQVFDILE